MRLALIGLLVLFSLDVQGAVAPYVRNVLTTNALTLGSNLSLSAGVLNSTSSGVQAGNILTNQMPLLGIGSTNIISTNAVGFRAAVGLVIGTDVAPVASPTFTGTATFPTPFTLGAVSVLPTGTELNFVDGVTSAIQTQLNNAKIGTVGFTSDGAGSAISTGKTKGFIVVGYSATITGWSIVVDTGTATVKCWKIASGTAKPTIANVINTAGVSISTGTAISSTTVTDFTTTTVTAGDIFAFDITALSGATELTFQLSLAK